MPDGSLVVIAGSFKVVTPPRRLSYTWQLESSTRAAELVTVRFEPCGDATDVVIVHERITDAAVYASHDEGWLGCLEGLADYLTLNGDPRAD